MHAPLPQTCRAEWRKLDALAPIADEWRALAAQAIEPNVFYEPGFALAAGPVFGADAGAVLVRSATGRLLGLFPARAGRPRAGLVPLLNGWTHPFAPLGVPLVARGEPEATIAAWLDFLAGERSMPALMLLPYLPEQGPFAEALGAVLARRGLRSATFGHHHRAMLEPGAAREGYLDRALSSSRRKELRRQHRRLEEIAPVTFSSTSGGEELASALKDFLVLEASGWKGLAGTAIVNDPAIRAFVEQAVTALAADGHVRIDRMMLSGRAIAATVTLSSGSTSWCWKIGYNEGIAKFSPGVQLVCELTGRLLADGAVARVDSCATADHPMIDHIWRERLSLSDRLIALRPSPVPFATWRALESLRRATLDAAKSARDRLRGLRKTAGSGLRAQKPADHLAGGGHRHLVDEGDLARVLMRGQARADKILDVSGKPV